MVLINMNYIKRYTNRIMNVVLNSNYEKAMSTIKVNSSKLGDDDCHCSNCTTDDKVVKYLYEALTIDESWDAAVYLSNVIPPRLNMNELFGTKNEDNIFYREIMQELVNFYHCGGLKGLTHLFVFYYNQTTTHYTDNPKVTDTNGFRMAYNYMLSIDVVLVHDKLKDIGDLKDEVFDNKTGDKHMYVLVNSIYRVNKDILKHLEAMYGRKVVENKELTKTIKL